MEQKFYTLQDENGKLLPLAGIFKYDQYGLDDAEVRASKTDTKVVIVRMIVVED